MARKKIALVAEKESKALNRNQAIQAILKLVGKHNETVSAVLNDYLVTDGAELEIGTAGTNLWNDIEAIIFEDEPEEDFDTLFNKLKNIEDDLTVVEFEKLTTLFSDAENMEFMKGQVISKGYALIKVDTLDQKEKIQQFAETEIWPDYNQQRKKIVI